MKQQQTRKPPKPANSSLHHQGPPPPSIAKNLTQTIKSSKSGANERGLGKENGDGNRGAALQQKSSSLQVAQQQKQRFKSNGAKQRPQTACLQSKLTSPQNDAPQPKKHLFAAQQASLNNTVKLPQTAQQQSERRSHVVFEDTSKLLLCEQQKQVFNNKNLHHHINCHQQVITGRKVQQPKLIVQNVVDNNSELKLHRQSRLSPQSRACLLKYEKRANKSTQKKSKSQTISSTQNLKSQQSSRLQHAKQQRKFLDFLDSSLLVSGEQTHNVGHPGAQNIISGAHGIEDEKEQTLKMLTHLQSGQGGVRAARGSGANSADRNKVQMKYLNFHRKNVIKAATTRSRQNSESKSQSRTGQKRSTTTIKRVNNDHAHDQQMQKRNINKTQSTSADRIHGLACGQTSNSFSPRSKTGSAVRRAFGNEIIGSSQANSVGKDKSGRKSTRKGATTEMLTKSAVDIPGGISTILFDRSSVQGAFQHQQINDDQLSLRFNQKQSNSTLQKRSGAEIQKRRSPTGESARQKKIDKLIKENIRKEQIVQERTRKELREREASSQRRKEKLEQKNREVRRINQEKIQRRRLKLKDQRDSSGVKDDETKMLEEALLAVSDGVQQQFGDCEQNRDYVSGKVQKVGAPLRPKTDLKNRIKKLLSSELLTAGGNVVSHEKHLNTTTQPQGLYRYGNEFLDIHKQINSASSKQHMNSTNKKHQDSRAKDFCDLDLQTSKSQKLSSSLQKAQPFTGEQPDSVLKATTKNLKKAEDQSAMLSKREKIRKFMKEKAKLMQRSEQLQRANEMKSLRKVRCNLTKLNEFVHQRMTTTGQQQSASGATMIGSGITTPALKVKRNKNRNGGQQIVQTGPSMQGAVCGTETDDNQKRKQFTNLNAGEGSNKQHLGTPNRIGRWFDQDSLNISAKCNGQNRSQMIQGQQTHKELQKMHDTLYEDSRLSSMDDRSAKRKDKNQNGEGKVLSVCFEKSASQKAIRKQARQSNSPQIMRPRQSTGGSSNNRSRPRSALSLSGGSKSQNKRKIQKPSKKNRSSLRGQPMANIPRQCLTAQGKLSVLKRTNQSSRHQSPGSKNSQGQVADSYDQVSACEGPHGDIEDLDEEMTLNLRFSEGAAATVIQKEVRKYLGNLGFYQARIDQSEHKSARLYSPSKPIINGQVDIFLEKECRSITSKKSKSPARKSSSRSPTQRGSSNKRRVAPQEVTYELVDPNSTDSVKFDISHEQLQRIQLFQQQQLRQHLSPSEPVQESFLNIPGDLAPSHRSQASRHSTSRHEQSQASLFDRNSFQQQFSQQKLLELLKDNEFQKLIQCREECLLFRQSTEMQLIDRAFYQQQITPRSYQRKVEQIERWVRLQRQDLEQTKLGFKEEWQKTVQMVEETQKQLDVTKSKLLGQPLTNSQNSQAQSQSHSFRAGKPGPKSSLLMDEAPQSYRSALSHPQQQQNSQGSLPDCGLLTQTNLKESKNTNSGEQTPHEPSDAFITRLERATNGLLQDRSKQTSLDSQRDPLLQSCNLGARAEGTDESADNLILDSNLSPLKMDGFSAEQSQQEGNNGLTIEENSFNSDALKKKLANQDSVEQSQQSLNQDGYSQDNLGGDMDDADSNCEDEDDILIDDYNDNGFKNQIVQIKDLNKLFAQGQVQHHNSDSDEDDHLAEQVQKATNKQEEIDASLDSTDQLPSEKGTKISDILKQQDQLKQSVNYVSEIEQSKHSSDSNDRCDRITDEMLEQLVEECLQLPKRAKQKTPPPPLPDPDCYTALEQHLQEREEKKEWIEIRQRHLIEATLIRADSYVNEVVDVLLQFDISDISENSDFDYGCKPTDNFHIQFLKLLTQPIQRSPMDLLELMQKSELGNYNHFETTLDISKFPILSVDLYLEIEKVREETMMARKSSVDAKKLQIWESIHIFNKCIFDSINESLMKFRPYGIAGQPMPWSNKVRRLQTKVEIASVDTERLFQMVKQEIFRWSQVFCGCLPGPVFYFPNQRTGKDEFAEDLHQEVRERRLTSILTQDQVEQEHHWLNYEFEEAQVKVDLSDMILEALVSEVIDILGVDEP